MIIPNLTCLYKNIWITMSVSLNFTRLMWVWFKVCWVLCLLGGSGGTDHLDSKLLKISSVHVSKPISHIFNTSLISGVFPKLWKDAKIIPLPKDTKATFCGPNSKPISILPVFRKLLEKIVYRQVQDYFTVNCLPCTNMHIGLVIQLAPPWYKCLTVGSHQESIRACRYSYVGF